MKTPNLLDVWRNHHPHDQLFTWYRQQPKVMCPLDMFLISSNLNNVHKTSKIQESIKTDHKLISLEIDKSQKQACGPGFYTFNSSLLLDKEYVNNISNLILEKNQELNFIIDKGIQWDLLKFEIQYKTIEFSKRKAKERRQLENDTQTKCDLLFKKMCRDQLTSNEEEEYQTCKEILEGISSYKEQGTHIRLRVDFIEKYEKSKILL